MLSGISKTLRDYLAGTVNDARVEIGEFRQGKPLPTDDTLLLFLYHLEGRGGAPNPSTRPAAAALELKLYYLITSTTENTTDLQDDLSQVLEAFDSHPVFRANELDGSISGRVDSLRIQLTGASPADVQNIWIALGTGMRLSLYYDVSAELSL